MIQIQSETDLLLIWRNYTVVVVVFTAKWCPTCEKIQNVLQRVDLDEQVILVNVDIDNPSVSFLTQKIAAIPALYYYKNGSLYFKEQGLKTKEHICKNIISLKNLNQVY